MSVPIPLSVPFDAHPSFHILGKDMTSSHVSSGSEKEVVFSKKNWLSTTNALYSTFLMAQKTRPVQGAFEFKVNNYVASGTNAGI